MHEPKTNKRSWRVLRAATPKSHVLGTAPEAASPLDHPWMGRQPTPFQSARVFQATADTTRCVESWTLRGINSRLGILQHERHSNLATPFPPTAASVLSVVAPGAICSGLFAKFPLPLFRSPRFRAFLPPFSSSWCDRRFSFHILGELLLACSAMIRKTENEKGITTIIY